MVPGEQVIAALAGKEKANYLSIKLRQMINMQ
jgi:hypothetical protein